MTRRVVLFAGTASTAAWMVRYVPVPSAATVGVPDGAVVVVVGAPPTRLNDHCIRAMSEQVAWTIGLLPAVEPSLSLMHIDVAAFTTRYFPAAADEAVNVHNWLD